MSLSIKIIFLALSLVLFSALRVDSGSVMPIDPVSENWAEEQLSQLTLREKIGQFFMVAASPQRGGNHLVELADQVAKDKVGGLIFFKATKEEYQTVRDQMNGLARLPLLIGMDAEWGAGMRLTDVERFPYAYTIGGADDLALTAKLGDMMAQECRELGIHLSFGPVADVNLDPKNPVIGYRSYGENPNDVAKHVVALVKGYEQNGVMSSIKHFPGHGDTDVDSHLELPVVDHSMTELEAIDFLPFQRGIDAGASTVMIGHIAVPALDSTNTPASLSKVIIQDYLRNKMNFKGIVVSDALNMKAVSTRYGKDEVVLKAFQAGCDILLFPESVTGAIDLIEKNVLDGTISREEIDRRCLKLLKAKQKFILQNKDFKKYTQEHQLLARYQTYEKATVLAKNTNDLLPIKDVTKKTLHVSVGGPSNEFYNTLLLYSPVKHKEIREGSISPTDVLELQMTEYERVIISVHASHLLTKEQFGMPSGLHLLLDNLPDKAEKIVVLFGNPLALAEKFNWGKATSLVLAYENNELVQNRVAQQLYAGERFVGKLPFLIPNWQEFKRGSGITTNAVLRLKYTLPEELGIASEELKRVDQIVQAGIDAHAFPGCQVVAAKDGKVFLHKSYGSHQYDGRPVKNSDVYDLASISKIAGSTLGLMHLQNEEKFSLDSTLGYYLPELVKGYPHEKIKLKEMMAHQAGLKSWIPFYKSTMTAGKPSSLWYHAAADSEYNKQVADELYMRQDYVDSMYSRILNYPLGAKTYEYSDLGYYFVKRIIEKTAQQPMDVYMQNQVYKKLGLHAMVYNPLQYMSRNAIVPTEKDGYYRMQLVHGYVHDMGAAMLGGVGGHAGVFANASSLATLMQVFLNKGSYGGQQILRPEIVELYTKAQYSGNRRGAGFDRPKAGGGGTCDESASQSSYGHSGFTGTLAWVDPANGLNYVFLSNRVYPDAENWKLVKMGTRTEIQKVLNKAIANAKP